MPELFWIDGEIVPAEKAVVPAADRGLLYGDGLFETLLGLHGQVAFLNRHIARLNASAHALRIPCPLSPQELCAAVGEVVERADEGQLYLRITLTRGVGGRPSELDAGAGRLIIWARPYPGYPQHLYENGMAAVLATTRRNQHSPLCKHKTLNYLDNLLAKAEAAENGADEAILLNTDGRIAEASASNLFIVVAEKLLTPPLDDGALPGIVRQVIIEIAAELGIPCAERSLLPGDLAQADEAFLTNGLMGVMPLCRFAASAIGCGQPGPVTRRLRESCEDMLADL